MHTLQSLVVSLLLSLVSTLVFSRTGCVLSHRNSSTRRFPPRNLCSLCFLSSSLQRTQSSVKFLSFKDWANRKFFLQRLWTPVPGHFLSHSALSSYGLFASLTFRRLFVSLRPLDSCPASGAPWSSAMPSFLGRCRANNNFQVPLFKY